MKPAVLYIEDDKDNRNVMQFLLHKQLCLEHVAIWEDSENFEQRLTTLDFSPDIVLLDIHIEPIDGFQMLAILRTHQYYRNVPVVAVTASVMNEEIQRLQDAGFNGVISKPIDIDLFSDHLERFLQGEEIWH